MSRLKVIARLVTGAASAVALSVVTSQVRTDGELHPSWLYLSGAVALMSALYGEVLGPDPSVGSRPVVPAARLPAGGRRGVYLRQLRDSVRTMETVGIATQGEFVLGMRQLYVDVSLAPQPPHRTTSESYVGQTTTSSGERRTLSSFLTGDNQVFAVIGGPGSGKTTLMRSTALALCHRGPRRRRLPVLLYLRDHAQAILADDPRGLAEVAADAGWVAGKTAAAWIERRLDKGGCLVLLDGLDEVADEEDRGRVVGWIKRQTERYPRNDYLVTSRPHGYLSNPLPNANVLQVRRFIGEQISRFLHNWYDAIECRALGATGKQVRVQATAKADDLLGRLRSRPGLYDLAANPLLLTMIANVHRYRDALPGSRAALYGEMCQVLVHRRQESKGLSDRTGLRGPQKEHIMQRLALTMMCERLRDIPIAAAGEAIEDDLRGASTDVAPVDFLDEVRKSGLLIEREHGRYAFAHLTLQEYLAAAPIGDKDLERLTDGVDDPWWRETTLLWAANADATPVVTACLEAGTVRALSLAFDCADEARTLDPAVRAELEALLISRPDENTARHRLITGVKAARSLREVIWLNEDIAVCAHPVSGELYAAFAHDEKAAGRHMPAGTTLDATSVAADAPATGMWASDVTRFVTWLNNLFDDGTHYRLPSATELQDPAIDLITEPGRHTIWTHPGAGPRLHQPPGAVWPYASDPGAPDYPTRDLQRALPYLNLAVRPPRTAKVRAFISVFTTALVRTTESDEADHFVLYLALARDLARVLVLYLSRSDSSALASARALDRARALDLDLDLARTLARTLASARDRALDLDLASDLARTLARTLASARDRALVRASDLDLDLVRALLRALVRASGLANDLVRARDLASARDLDRALDGARDLALDRVRINSVDFDLLLAVVLDADLGRTIGDDLDQWDTDPDIASASAIALDIVLDQRAVTADIQRQRSVIDAFCILLAHWAPSRGKRPRPGRALSAFAEYLASIVAATPEPAIRKVPAVALQEAADRVGPDPVGSISPADQVQRLLSHVRGLITPILERTAPIDPETLGCARIELLAVAALLDTQRHDAVSLVVELIRGLIAIQEREDGRLTPNEVILLVRA